MLDTIEMQQQQFSGVGNEHLFPDASIPITFTKVHTWPPLIQSYENIRLERNTK